MIIGQKGIVSSSSIKPKSQKREKAKMEMQWVSF